MTATRTVLFRTALMGLAGALLLPAALLPAAAQAHWRGGVYYGFPPVYVGPPPVYYPPVPIYVAPPPVYVAPPAYSTPSESGPPPAGQVCYAGQWVCPLDHPVARGDSCSCAATDGRSWGRAR